DLGGGLQLHSFGCLCVAVVVADDDEGTDLDLALHIRTLADDEGVGRDDLTRELAVDADAPLEEELSLEGAALAEERVQLARARASARSTAASASASAAECRRTLAHVFLAHRHRNLAVKAPPSSRLPARRRIQVRLPARRANG